MAFCFAFKKTLSDRPCQWGALMNPWAGCGMSLSTTPTSSITHGRKPGERKAPRSNFSQTAGDRRICQQSTFESTLAGCEVMPKIIVQLSTKPQMSVKDTIVLHKFNCFANSKGILVKSEPVDSSNDAENGEQQHTQRYLDALVGSCCQPEAATCDSCSCIHRLHQNATHNGRLLPVTCRLDHQLHSQALLTLQSPLV